MAYLVLLNEDKTTTTVELTKPRTTLGSKPDNDLVAPVKGVSRHHAQVVVKEGKFLLEDLDSTNFVFVNGQQVDKFWLKDGVVFTLGDYAAILFLEQVDDVKIRKFLDENLRDVEPKNTTRIIHKNLPKTVKELEILIEVGSHINSTLELKAVLETIIDKTLTLIRADRGFIMLLENGQLVPKIARNMETELIDDQRYAFSASFAKKVIERKELLISTNVAEDPRYKSASIISHKILSIMSAPLKVQEEVIGCLYVDIRQSTRYFSEQDAAFFGALANQASIAIHNARLADNLKKNQLFLEQTNAQLQRSLEKLIETNLKLERQRTELGVLYEVSRALNMAPDMDSILRSILGKIRELLGAERGSLMMYDERLGGLVVRIVDGAKMLPGAPVVLKLGEGVAGIVARTGKGILVNEGSKDKRFKHMFNRDSDVRQIICVPLMSNENCIGVINLVNNKKNREFTKDDLNLMTSIANLAAVSIEKFRLYQEKLNQEKLNLEIEDAQKVQQLLLPRTLPTFPCFEFSAKYALANRVGGDYYDFIPVDENRLAVVIADVSGHDIASALVMAMGRNLIRTLFDIHKSPAEVLSKTSLVLRQDTQSCRYITMFLGILDSRQMTLTYSNAGHNYPLYLKSGEAEFNSLSVGGFPLGLVDDYNYLEETIQLAPGELLVLYTDGLIEAQSPSGEMFELRRLERIIKEYQHNPIEELATTIYEKALEFTQKEKLADDFTFVAIRAKPASKEMHLAFPSRLEEITPHTNRMVAFAQSNGFFLDDKFNLVLVLKEALTNAIEHGNKFDVEKQVQVSVIPTHKDLTIIVRDQGEGFNLYKVFSEGKKNLFKERGRGLIIMNEYADKVEFNDRGNEIRLIFCRSEEKRAGLA
ncbi:MAG: SpoIIE family protein phosphatase [Candidatus Riflebacteria bacterium]|nr:SpoIIE family protein phosphatase [Candidatus Riflebacteria bacterium]